jgi:hypothetical protein
VKEERYVERSGSRRVADDQASKETAVHVRLDHPNVVVERPGADRFVGDVEIVGPRVAGLDLVASPTVTCRDSERPRSVGINAVADAVEVQAVAVVRVGVEDVYSKILAWLGVQDGPRDTPIPRRLIDVGVDELRGVRDRVVLSTLAIDQRVDRRCRDLARLTADLVT